MTLSLQQKPQKTKSAIWRQIARLTSSPKRRGDSLRISSRWVDVFLERVITHYRYPTYLLTASTLPRLPHQNLANFDAHFHGTGPEIWRQTNGDIDAFVAGAGTGGTLAGTGSFLKHVNPDIQLVLADPQGSGLYHKVRNGVMYAQTEAEGKRRRYQVDTVVEGIGINRITANMQKGLDLIDDAYKVTDLEAVIMSRHLVEHDGLFLGSSSAVNLVAACRLAKSYGILDTKKTIVTILCDSGTRHYSKFW